MNREEGQSPFLGLELTGGLGALDTTDDAMAIRLTERLPLAESGHPLGFKWGRSGVWLSLLAAGKNDCFAAIAVGR